MVTDVSDEPRKPIFTGRGDREIISGLHDAKILKTTK